MLGFGDKKPYQHKRALLFVDNSGADIILGMLPLARELLRRGTEVSFFQVLEVFFKYVSLPVDFKKPYPGRLHGSCGLEIAFLYHVEKIACFHFYVMDQLMRTFLQVVLVANSLPALNDVTAMELPDIVAEAAKVCIVLKNL